jgi:hypothetical protein
MKSLAQQKRTEVRNFFLASLLFAQLIVWIWVLVDGWYSEKNFDFARISLRVRDGTFTSNETNYRLVPLWGQHYFGDLQIFFGFVGDPNPYFGQLRPQIPPFGLSFYSLLNFRGPQVGLIIWLSLTFLFSVLITYLWLKSETLSNRLMAYCALVLVNTSVLVGLDRGNILLILMTIVGFLFFKVLNSKRLTSFDAFLFASAISLKPYLLLLFIFFIFEKKYKFVFHTALAGLACNLIATLSFGWNPIAIFQNLISEQSRYNASDYWDFSLRNSSSAFRVLSDAVRLFNGPEYTSILFAGSSFWVAIPGIVYLVLVTIICWRRDIPIWIRMISVMSTAQMVVAATPRYTLVWTFIGGLLILQQPTGLIEKEKNEPRISRRELIVALGCGLGFVVGGLPIVVAKNLSPLVWIIVICLIFVIYVIPKRQKISENLSVNSKSEGMKFD